MFIKRFEDIAYHGSRFDFNQFDISMFGAGEGASGWGHGLYFSENIDDAKEYARKLERETGEGRLYKAKIPTKKYFYDLDKPVDEQSKYVFNCIMNMPKKYKIKLYETEYYENKQEIDNAVEKGEYDFEVNSDNYWELVDWLLNYNLEREGIGFFDEIKEKIYNNNDDAEYKTSQFFYKLGIKGNIHRGFHYLNYIVFDDKDIQIIKKTKPRY